MRDSDSPSSHVILSVGFSVAIVLGLGLAPLAEHCLQPQPAPATLQQAPLASPTSLSPQVSTGDGGALPEWGPADLAAPQLLTWKAQTDAENRQVLLTVEVAGEWESEQVAPVWQSQACEVTANISIGCRLVPDAHRTGRAWSDHGHSFVAAYLVCQEAKSP